MQCPRFAWLWCRPPNTPDVYLPAVDCDKALLARLNLTEKLTPGSEAYVQVRLQCGAPKQRGGRAQGRAGGTGVGTARSAAERACAAPDW